MFWTVWLAIGEGIAIGVVVFLVAAAIFERKYG